MQRLSLIAATLATLVGCAGSGGSDTAVPAGSAPSAAKSGKSATFAAKNEFKITVPDGAKSVRAWFAMPQDTPDQQVADWKVECALPFKIVKDDHGNTSLYVESNAPTTKEIALVESFKLTRHEILGDVDPAHAKPLSDADRAKFAADLAPNANVQITPAMVKLSKEIVGDEQNPVKAARKLYDWVLDNIDYWVKDPANKKASPVGSSEYCLTTKTGNCTDFHSLWVALARSAGIPSRIVYGSIFKPELAGQDKDQSYHCWPTFYATGIGWISQDVAVADIFHGTFPLNDANAEKVRLTTASGYTGPDEKLVNWYFGNIDDRRVVWSTGRDLKLDPPQAAGPVNALPKAYVEVDGAVYGEKSADGKTVQWTRKLTYTEVKWNVNAADPTPAVIAAVERGVGAACRDCGKAVCGHEVMMSFVLGFKGAPCCLSCLARGLAREPAEFGAEVRARIDHHDCWRAGWRRADELDRIGGDGRPVCVVGSFPTPAPVSVRGRSAMTAGNTPARSNATPESVDSSWDAGDLGCGDLVLELRVKLKAMKSGQLLKLTARDPGAPQDLPAWCGLTGHTLVHFEHPTYFIQRRKE